MSIAEQIEMQKLAAHVADLEAKMAMYVTGVNAECPGLLEMHSALRNRVNALENAQARVLHLKGRKRGE